jgi:hypothetical protein
MTYTDAIEIVGKATHAKEGAYYNQQHLEKALALLVESLWHNSRYEP